MPKKPPTAPLSEPTSVVDGARAAESSSLAIGTLVGGQYAIRRRLGRGGMGDIYLADDQVLGRRVAIKFLRPRQSAILASDARFRREARILSRLSHPNIVVVYAFGELDTDTLYIAMEYVPGRDLEAVLADVGRLQPDVFCDVFTQICAAVSHAHDAGIVHRDIKPANVIVTTDVGTASDVTQSRHIKVLDFGLAKVVDTSESEGSPAIGSSTLSAAGHCVGTPIYMSPEQARGLEVDARSDVYALAVMACQLLTGRLPLERRSTRRQILAHLMDAPILPSGLRPDLGFPRLLDDVIARGLSKTPEERFQSAHQFSQELVAAVRHWGQVPAGETLHAAGNLLFEPSEDPCETTTPDALRAFETAEVLAPQPQRGPAVSAGVSGSKQQHYLGQYSCLVVHVAAPANGSGDPLDDVLDCLGVVIMRLRQCVASYGGWTVAADASGLVAIWGADSAVLESENLPQALPTADRLEPAVDAALAAQTCIDGLRTDPSLSPSFRATMEYGITVDFGEIGVAVLGSAVTLLRGAPVARARAYAASAQARARAWLFADIAQPLVALYEIGPELPGAGGGYIAVTGKNKLATYRQGNVGLGFRQTLFGRDREREALHSALVEIIAMHEPRVVMLAGGPGLGKEGLISDFIRDVDALQEGYVFHVGRCAEAHEGSPFQPFIDAIRHHADIGIADKPATSRQRLRAYIQEKASPDDQFGSKDVAMCVWLEVLLGIEDRTLSLPTVAGEQAQRSLFFDAVARLYHRLAQRDPIVFIIKDFELATSATKALVSHFEAHLGEAPVMMLLSLESTGTHAADASFFRKTGVPHRIERIALAPLDPDATEAYVRDTLREMPLAPDFLVAGIALASAGRPWFADECVRCLIDRGTIRIDGGTWRLANGSDDAVALPTVYEEILADRLTTLASPLATALDVAAVAGRFWPKMLVDLCGTRLSGNSVFDLMQRGFIEERGEYVVGGEHDFHLVRRTMRQAIYRAMDPARRDRLHGAVADWLQQHCPSASMIHDARVGAHLRHAQRWEEAFPFTLRAAQRAKRSHALDMAIELFERAVELLERAAASVDPSGTWTDEALHQRVTLAVELVPLLVGAGREEAAVAVAQAAIAPFRAGQIALGESRGVVGRIALWLGRAHSNLGDYDSADAVLSFGVENVPAEKGPPAVLRLELETERALAFGLTGDISSAYAVLRNTLTGKVVRAAKGSTVVANAYNELANAEAQLGKTGDALRHFNKAIALARNADAPAAVVDALADRAALQAKLGQARKAAEGWKQAVSLAQRWDLARRHADVLMAWGADALDRRQGSDALERLKVAYELHDHLSCDDGLAMSGRLLADTLLAMGQEEAALPYAQRAADAAEALEDPRLCGLAHRAMWTATSALARRYPLREDLRTSVRRHYNAALTAFESIDDQALVTDLKKRLDGGGA